MRDLRVIGSPGRGEYVPLASGVWLMKAVHMERAEAGTGADWESVWTALTFRVQ